MIAEKKEVIVLSVVKAIITTALIGLAINRMDVLLTTTDTFTRILTTSIIGIVCLVGTALYSYNLLQKGILKTARQFFHTYGISWQDNASLLTWSWLESGSIGVLLVISIIFSNQGVLGIYPCIVALCFGILFVYIFRKDCTKTTDYIKYFIYGYVFGIGMIIAGVLISFLMSIFGAFWIGLLITIDFVFTGAYTYLDLLEWEHEGKIKEAKAAARAEAKAQEEIPDDKRGVA